MYAKSAMSAFISLNTGVESVIFWSHVL